MLEYGEGIPGRGVVGLSVGGKVRSIQERVNAGPAEG